MTQLDSLGLTETNRTSGRRVTDNAEVIERTRVEMAKEKIAAFLEGMKVLGFSKAEIIELIRGEME